MTVAGLKMKMEMEMKMKMARRGSGAYDRLVIVIYVTE